MVDDEKTFTKVKHPIMKFPYRSPLDIVKAIEHIIKGKVVCDIGCACGDILFEMKDLCEDIIGVELNTRFKEKINNLGLDRSFIKWGDLFEIGIPEADVYFLWISPSKDENKEIIDRLKTGSIIIDVTSAIELFNDFDELELLEKFEYEYNESEYNGTEPHASGLPQFNPIGSRFVRIYRKNK